MLTSLWRRPSSTAGAANSSAAYNLLSVFWQGMDLLKMLDAKLECFSLSPSLSLFLYPQETCQVAGPIQGHGERGPEGGAVWKENAEEKGESLRSCLYVWWTLNAMCVCVCSVFFFFNPKVCKTIVHVLRWGDCFRVFLMDWGQKQFIFQLFLPLKLIQFPQFQCVFLFWRSSSGTRKRLHLWWIKSLNSIG